MDIVENEWQRDDNKPTDPRLDGPFELYDTLWSRELRKISTPYHATVDADFEMRRPKTFKFVEIGVFKGDNACWIIGLLQDFKTSVFYVGFDLFENKDAFFKLHPQDLTRYDTDEYPYWEFRSGQHALNNVKNKICSLLSENQFALIEGDSTVTVPSHLDKIYDATMIYIDACHEYGIVSQDWKNVRLVFESNPNLIVVFDDLLEPGVFQLKNEIEEMMGPYEVLRLNDNQFFVVSKNLCWRDKWILHMAVWLASFRDRISRHWRRGQNGKDKACCNEQ